MIEAPQEGPESSGWREIGKEDWDLRGKTSEEDREKLGDNAEAIAESACKKDPEIGKRVLKTLLYNYGIATIYSSEAERQGHEQDQESYHTQAKALQMILDLTHLRKYEDWLKGRPHPLDQNLFAGVSGRFVYPNEPSQSKG